MPLLLLGLLDLDAKVLRLLKKDELRVIPDGVGKRDG